MDQNDFNIEELKAVTPETAKAIKTLTKQIGNNAKELTDTDIADMLSATCNHLFVVKEKKRDHIVGMVTVLIFRIPYAKKAYLDDFVIDDDYRKQGLGTRLFSEAIDFAKSQKVAYIEFTSSQKREAANALYLKLGFKKRDTNVYRLNISYEQN